MAGNGTENGHRQCHKMAQKTGFPMRQNDTEIPPFWGQGFGTLMVKKCGVHGLAPTAWRCQLRLAERLGNTMASNAAPWRGRARAGSAMEQAFERKEGFTDRPL